MSVREGTSEAVMAGLLKACLGVRGEEQMWGRGVHVERVLWQLCMKRGGRYGDMDGGTDAGNRTEGKGVLWMGV